MDEAIKALPKLEFGASLSDANIGFCVTLYLQQVARVFRMVARAHWVDPNARTKSVWAIVNRLPMVVQLQMRETHRLARSAPVPATVTLDGLMESIKAAFTTVVARLKTVGQMEDLRADYKAPYLRGICRFVVETCDAPPPVIQDVEYCGAHICVRRPLRQ